MSEKYATFQERMKLRDRFQEVLSQAAKERSKRPDFETVADEYAIGWVFFERDQMLAEVNRQRSARGLQPLLLTDIKKVENLAVGHSDYGPKFSLYCAELAMGERNIRP